MEKVAINKEYLTTAKLIESSILHFHRYSMRNGPVVMHARFFLIIQESFPLPGLGFAKMSIRNGYFLIRYPYFQIRQGYCTIRQGYLFPLTGVL